MLISLTQSAPVTHRDHRPYHYYGGCIYAACKMWSEAKDMFETAGPTLICRTASDRTAGRHHPRNRCISYLARRVQEMDPRSAHPHRQGQCFLSSVLPYLNTVYRSPRFLNTHQQAYNQHSRTCIPSTSISLHSTQRPMWTDRSY